MQLRLPTLPASVRPPRVLVIGAGVGGLTAAALLARQGVQVHVLEMAPSPGGKLREVAVGSRMLDSGPTVLTMRWVFDALFDALGQDFGTQVTLQRCEVLARHAWGPEPKNRLDLLANLEASAEAIGHMAGAAEARRYLAFCRRAEAVFNTLDGPFLRSPRPNPVSLAWRVGLHRMPDLLAIAPFRNLWQELGRYFQDPRLRQLFGRYATYCGSSPFDAPATLMLVAHVERAAVWQLEGGMQSLALALAQAARSQGVQISCDQEVREITLSGRGADGVVLANGERLVAPTRCCSTATPAPCALGCWAGRCRPLWAAHPSPRR
ncbi:MAG: FAD-dependent oxidoreductase [Ideonella sp.]|nr:FAD-dependent oxidoreductase [Ideonella sp.]